MVSQFGPRITVVETLLDGKGILHHLGFVVASIPAVAEEFARSMSPDGTAK